jgi:enamine deaminase RidA (YjgF/YER057c/UK114 family)
MPTILDLKYFVLNRAGAHARQFRLTEANDNQVSPMRKTLQPSEWERPKGYANGIATSAGETIYTAGMVGWDAQGKFPGRDFVKQVRATLENIVRVLEEAGAGPEHLVRMTWYITDKQAYLDNLAGVGAAYREVIGKNFPTMAVVQVVALMEDDAMVEIEAIAVK